MGTPEKLCMPRNTIKRGMRVLIIDDLIATGGSMLTAVNLVKSQASHHLLLFILRYLPLICKLNLKETNHRVG